MDNLLEKAEMEVVNDTVAALSTSPAGSGGIGIIRISGPDSLKVGLKVFSHPSIKGSPESSIKERYLYLGDFIDPVSGAVLDRGLFVYMKGPRSYTGEDTVELHGHGGMVGIRSILDSVVVAGARIAEGGEFTKRAFLNGKVDLLQAEGVVDTINAASASALRAATSQLSGNLSRRINAIKEPLVELCTYIEAELDFQEEEIDTLSADEMMGASDGPLMDMETLLQSYGEGIAIKEGVKVLLLGSPNVGKSSLMNLLLRRERAIVTDIPGTTRDLIEEHLSIRGIPLWLMDTAGIREGGEEVERIGIERAKAKTSEAGVILLVVDPTVSDFTGEDNLIGSLTPEERGKVVVVMTKRDIAGVDDIRRGEEHFGDFPVTALSTLLSRGDISIDGEAVSEGFERDPEGLKAFEELFYSHVTGSACRGGGGGDILPGELLTSARHKEALLRAKESLTRFREGLCLGYGGGGGDPLPGEILAIDLKGSIDALGSITGEVTSEDILNRIFSDFCIGK